MKTISDHGSRNNNFTQNGRQEVIQLILITGFLLEFENLYKSAKHSLTRLTLRLHSRKNALEIFLPRSLKLNHLVIFSRDSTFAFQPIQVTV